MPHNPARELLIRCLERVTAGDAGHYVENPATEFTRKAKRGDFDQLDDDEYMDLLHKVERLAKFWRGRPKRPAGEVLLCLLEKTVIPTGLLETDVADPLMKWYDWDSAELDEHGNPPAAADEPEIAAALEAAFAPRRPREIRDAIAVRVLGQPEAAKAAAMIVHGRLAGRRTNAVFAGPSGCGKSEIWRCLSKEYPGLVRMIDFSRVCGEGWNGSLHLRDVFAGVNPDDIERHGLVVVLDEADKILCETAIGSGGGNHNHIIQNNLLKMLDGDVIEFGAEHGEPAFSIDCSKVSVVMLGAFENLLTKKTAAGARHIGFGPAPEAGPPIHKDIGYDDLIQAGARREIAGRVNRIVALNQLDAADYKKILKGPVLSDLEKDFGCRIILKEAAADMLSEQAAGSDLGVRWAKSAMRNAIEDALFDADAADECRIGIRDGKLVCRAKSASVEAPTERAAAYAVLPDMALPF